ncbi:hypothetical protein FJN17_03325 [Bradyrhizobium symbiodeficiens]|uniref:Uncharacterized protein n=1 Tax=Bradyrhizobium symbiodeficiens TaxID=1404367 RepID=A0ABX5W2D3_9BRAD|nr:hypothetical protein [Bradyrhizobium symbiodeficiens]QDF36669.1 hypothetical protein FJN17_03325 [Bradyrhizobium symbiodeficiens]
MHLPELFWTGAPLAGSARWSSDVVAAEAKASDIMTAAIVPIASAAVLDLKFPSLDILSPELLASDESDWMKTFMTISSN